MTDQVLRSDTPTEAFPRRATFWASYPRAVKLAVLVMVVGIGSSPGWWERGGRDVLVDLGVSAWTAWNPAPPPAKSALMDDPWAAHDAAKRSGAPSAVPAPSQTVPTPSSPPKETAKPVVPTDDLSPAARAAIAQNDAFTDVPLGTAPPTEDQGLQRVVDDGRRPRVYARPFNPRDPRPRLALVVGGLGMSREATEVALATLPSPVTLVFDAQAPALATWMERARQGGHETLVDTPMEPLAYPRNDPGPGTLLTMLSEGENARRFDDVLRRAPGVVGITTFSGTRFTADASKLAPVMTILRQRGLLFFDARLTSSGQGMKAAMDAQVPVAEATLALDENLSPGDIDAALERWVGIAGLRGQAIATVQDPRPVVLDHVRAWMKTLPRRGVALAPLSALVTDRSGASSASASGH